MADIFEENYRCYDYRRLHAMLRGNNRVISEKVVRRLMAEEQLVVKRTRATTIQLLLWRNRPGTGKFTRPGF